MTIFTGTFNPYEYVSKRDVLWFIESACRGVKRSLRLIEKDSEHLTVRCPLYGDYLEITGSPEELTWLDNELKKRDWYRHN